MSAKPAVWITGLGVASPAGVGVDALWARLRAPDPQGLLVERPPAREGLSVPPAVCFPRELPAEEWVDPRRVRKASGLSRLTLVAAQLAWQDAGGLPAAVKDEAATVVGTTLGSSDYYLRFYEALLRRGPKAANAVLFTEGVFNAPSGHLSAAHGLRGFGHTLVGGEEAGLSAALLARDRIVLGRARAALCGGAEAYCDLAHASLWREERVGGRLAGVGAFGPGAFAEGACLAVLERADDARARGARGYAELLAGSRRRSASDDPAAFDQALGDVLGEAGLGRADLDLLVVDACSGSRAQRLTDIAFLEFFPDAGEHHAWAPMAGIGEGFAFGSALALASAALALHHGVVCPTHGEARQPCYSDFGPCMAREPLERPLRHALVVSASEPGAVVMAVLRKV
ncbi:MAG: beta-ketoacyl synthase N-terminal-like domain-containing protein [Planctomycetota bacterium]